MSLRLPAEWEAQDGVLLVWPHDRTDWRDQLQSIEALYDQLASTIAQYETAVIVCRDAEHQTAIETRLTSMPSPKWPYRFLLAPSNDSWVRDFGPLTVYRDEQTIALDFVFNAWGGKYGCANDHLLTRRLFAQPDVFQAQHQTVPDVLEGGGIESDGTGTMLCTTSCLLSSTRNPYFSRNDYLKQFRELFGTQRILWLEEGYLPGDDTDGHIDTLARFCDADTIAYVSGDDLDDDFAHSLRQMEAALKKFRKDDNTPYRLVALPPPPPMFDQHGQRLPASYANFLIINGAVLVPCYGDPADQKALTALATCFPDRAMIGIDCTAAIAQFGSLHCLTMQLPRGTLIL